MRSKADKREPSDERSPAHHASPVVACPQVALSGVLAEKLLLNRPPLYEELKGRTKEIKLLASKRCPVPF